MCGFPRLSSYHLWPHFSVSLPKCEKKRDAKVPVPFFSFFSFLFSLSLLFSVPFFTDSRERVGCTGLFDICVSAP